MFVHSLFSGRLCGAYTVCQFYLTAFLSEFFGLISTITLFAGHGNGLIGANTHTLRLVSSI